MSRRGASGDRRSATSPATAAIFVTVGTELPFDRLVRAIDDWAGESSRGDEVFAQIGSTGWAPAHIRSAPMLGGADFRRLFAQAEIVIAHAGMGTILAALEQGRPLIVVPRRADLGEHRNDHQLATVDRLTGLGLVTAVADENELVAHLRRDGGRSLAHLAVTARIGPDANPSLIATVQRGLGSSTNARRGRDVDSELDNPAEDFGPPIGSGS